MRKMVATSTELEQNGWKVSTFKLGIRNARNTLRIIAQPITFCMSQMLLGK